MESVATPIFADLQTLPHADADRNENACRPFGRTLHRNSYVRRLRRNRYRYVSGRRIVVSGPFVLELSAIGVDMSDPRSIAFNSGVASQIAELDRRIAEANETIRILRAGNQATEAIEDERDQLIERLTILVRSRNAVTN